MSQNSPSFYINLPLILPTAILLSSLFQSNDSKLSGIIYMVCLLCCVTLRTIVMGKIKPQFNNGFLCSSTFFNGREPNASIFVSVFTLAYVAFPLAYTKEVNASILIAIGIISAFTIFELVSKYYFCFSGNIQLMVGDSIFGIVAGLLSVIIVIGISFSASASSPFLFTSSNKISSPSKQKMVCSVYKNGELVSKL